MATGGTLRTSPRLIDLMLIALPALLACDSATSPVAPGETVLTASANPKSIGLNGSSTITVTARHPSGVPARRGQAIFLTSTLGSVMETIVMTDDAGIAQPTLHG